LNALFTIDLPQLRKELTSVQEK
jgi:hypothetical protein